jgi:hypothetical protein
MNELRWRFILGGHKWLPDVGSEAIAWFSANPLSHVDQIVPDGISWAREGWMLGARADALAGLPAGFRPRPPNYTTFSRWVIVSLPVTDRQYQRAWEFHEAQLGKPYDSTAIVAFLLSRDWRRDDSWMCSEEQTAMCEHAEIMPAGEPAGRHLYFTPNKVTPAHFACLLSVLPGVAIEHSAGFAGRTK